LGKWKREAGPKAEDGTESRRWDRKQKMGPKAEERSLHFGRDDRLGERENFKFKILKFSNLRILNFK
jgi:hypothetical protein